MNIRKCKSCGFDKPLNEFASKGRRVSGTQRLKHKCKECENKRLREYRAANPKPRNLNTTPKESIALWFLKLKETLSCMDCSLPFKDQGYLCDFHHTDPKTKLFHLGGAHKSHGKEAILSEVSKCIPLCSNCHRRRHHSKKIDMCSEVASRYL